MVSKTSKVKRSTFVKIKMVIKWSSFPESHKKLSTRSWITSPKIQTFNGSPQSYSLVLFEIMGFIAPVPPLPSHRPHPKLREWPGGSRLSRCRWRVACHVRHIRFSVGGRNDVPERFFEYTPWFVRVERMALMGLGMFHLLEPLWTPSLPQAAL